MKELKPDGIYLASALCGDCYRYSKEIAGYKDVFEMLAARKDRDEHRYKALKILGESNELLKEKYKAHDGIILENTSVKSSVLKAACANCSSHNYESPAIKNLAINLGLVEGVEI